MENLYVTSKHMPHFVSLGRGEDGVAEEEINLIYALDGLQKASTAISYMHGTARDPR